jgi:hypothetical protein
MNFSSLVHKFELKYKVSRNFKFTRFLCSKTLIQICLLLQFNLTNCSTVNYKLQH